MRHWTDAWLGRPWVEGRFECTDLVVAVEDEHFGRRLDWPAPAASLRARDAQWQGLAGEYAAPVPDAEARDGDVAHLTSVGYRLGVHHLGVLCVLPDAERRILHCARGLGTCLHRPADVAAMGWELQGYYRPFTHGLES